MKKVLAVLLAAMLITAFAGAAMAAGHVSPSYYEIAASSLKLGDTVVSHDATKISDLQRLITATNLAEKLENKNVFASWNIYTTVATGTAFTVVASNDLPAVIKSGLGAIIMTETYSGSSPVIETFEVFDTVASITVTGKTISIPLTKSLTTASNKTTWIFLVRDVPAPTPEPKPVKPDLPYVPEDVQVVSVGLYDSVDIAAAASGISADCLSIDIETNKVVPIKAFVNTAAKEAIADLELDFVEAEEVPVAYATVAPDKIATFAYEIPGVTVARFTDKLENLKVAKIFANGSGILFKIALASADFKDEYITILKSGDIYTGAISSSDTYQICAFIKDSGSFDLDGESNGLVVDPMAIIKATEKKAPSGSSGGCSAGFVALALLAVPFVIRRKK